MENCRPAMPSLPPALLVHGIHDTARTFRKVREALTSAGQRSVRAVDLTPNNGDAPICELARQVDDAAAALLKETGSSRIDLVGFSMGSLVSRYWIQRLGGRERARRFISISGPHAGTWLAHLSGRAGIRDMRPGSALLCDLEADEDPWGQVEAHVLYTPLDLMILPARSSVLRKAASEQTIPVVFHPLMLSDRRVIERITSLLGA